MLQDTAVFLHAPCVSPLEADVKNTWPQEKTWGTENLVYVLLYRIHSGLFCNLIQPFSAVDHLINPKTVNFGIASLARIVWIFHFYFFIFLNLGFLTNNMF